MVLGVFFIATVGRRQLRSTQPTSHLKCTPGLQHLATRSLNEPGEAPKLQDESDINL